MMRKLNTTAVIIIFLTMIIKVQAQEFRTSNNMVINGSFEELMDYPLGTGEFYKARKISSPNHTSIDLYSRKSRSHSTEIPDNYMGTQECAEGNSYMGLVTYYADESGLFSTQRGYQQYSEYLQMELEEPLEAGKVYTLSFKNSLAEKSAYAISGLGVYFSSEKLDVNNNSYMDLTPHMVTVEISASDNWEQVTGTYVATGGEKFMILGAFDKYMFITKVIPEYINNSRKAYYYIDEVSLTSEEEKKDDLTAILTGACFKLEHLNFETNNAVILPESFNELMDLSIFLQKYPYLDIYIDGHSDLEEPEEVNENLSIERAQAVKEFLRENGVEEHRMITRGFGNNYPLEEGEGQIPGNRRVEITACYTAN